MLIRITVFRNNQMKISLVATIVAFTCTEAFHELGLQTNAPHFLIARGTQQLGPGTLLPGGFRWPGISVRQG